jgi:hypothetical protein
VTVIFVKELILVEELILNLLANLAGQKKMGKLKILIHVWRMTNYVPKELPKF